MLLSLLVLATGCGQEIRGLAPGTWDTLVVASPAQAPHALPVDTRSSEEYAEAHIPGAAHVYWGELNGLDESGLWDAGAPQASAELLGARGIARDTPVLLYGNGPDGWGDDGDVYWTLRYLGHDEIYVLDGGWSAWLAAGGETTDAADAPEPTTYTAELQPQVYATSDDVADWDGVILDVRSPEEWAEGHIPGAIWMEWSEVYDAGTLKDQDQVTALFADLGVTPNTPTVTYCQGGIRAGHTFMMLEAIGVADARNYVGSWARWTAEDREIAQ